MKDRYDSDPAAVEERDSEKAGDRNLKALFNEYRELKTECSEPK